MYNYSTYIDLKKFNNDKKHGYAASCRSYKKNFHIIARSILVHFGCQEEDPRFKLVKKKILTP